MTTDLSLLAELEQAGAITPTSLTLPDNTPYPRFEALCAYFGKVGHAIRWYIGDLICFGEGHYGDRVYQAAVATGLTPETLQNYASVCGRVAPPRRRESLAFSIHDAVASLPPAEQDRWLGLTEENGWTRKQLRELLADEGAITPRPQPAWSNPQPVSNNPRPIESTSPEGGPEDLSPVPQRVIETPRGPGSQARPAPLSGDAGHHPHALRLAQMRDGIEEAIDTGQGRGFDTNGYELDRDALDWALERLAPELA